ncbi:carboxylate--amine ligase, partial [Streptomyces virginiae]
ARVWQDGRPPARIGTSLLRLASWRAGRSGLDGPLLHPETMRQTSAEDAVEALYRHVREALEDQGDDERVREGIAHLHERGNGARTQRRLYAEAQELMTVVTRCAELTIAP